MANIYEDAMKFFYGHRLNPANVIEGYKELAMASDPKQKYFQAAKEMGKEFATKLTEYLSDPMNFAAQISPVYHGSPYKFTKFANEKIGTGEGAQAFGYGHYLSDLKDVANNYADLVGRHKLQKQGATENLYTATINKGKPSSADVFLEWDKPVDKNLINIKEVAEIQEQKIPHKLPDLIKYKQRNLDDLSNAVNGEEAYKILSKILGSEQEASQWLASKGITGIKYPTGTLSGIKGSPKYNYVVFDPENITIDAINDIPIAREIFSNKTGYTFYDDVLENPDFMRHVWKNINGEYKTVPENYWKGYKGFDWEVIDMSPKDYIKEAARGFNMSEKELRLVKGDIADLEEYIRKGNRPNLPVLEYGKDSFSQEGLHRALWAEKNNLDKIPVLIFTRDKMPVLSITERLKNAK